MPSLKHVHGMPFDDARYAEKYDEQKGRYIGLQAGQALQVMLDGVLVKPEVAAKQVVADRQERERAAGSGTTGGMGGPTGTGTATAMGTGTGSTTTATSGPTQPAAPRRFHATVELNTLKLASEAGRIAQEVIQHLTSRPNVMVKVMLEVEADIPDGAPQDLVRTITENCRTLSFKSHGFEEA